ncbi:MAG: response regulator [Ktedonobacterales bacterium]|nr:response regulator [Ktedonobacterales bacterium]
MEQDKGQQIPMNGGPEAAGEDASLRGRVAVVEDGEATRHFLVQRLRAQGYQVKGIEDGASALPLLRLHHPGVILLDATLPGLSGFEVCRQIRRDALLSGATVIMLTGRASLEDHMEAWAAGADDYLTKPCEIPELLARVAAHLRHREDPANQWLSLLTRLPALAALEAEALEWLGRAEAFTALFVDVAHFKSYNNRYGYLAGDALLVVLADLLREIATDVNDGRARNAAHITVGHLGSDDFVLLLPPALAEQVQALLQARFAAIAPSLYQGMDRERGWVPGTSAAGAAEQIPFVQLLLTQVECQPATAALPHPIAALWAQVRASATTLEEVH